MWRIIYCVIYGQYYLKIKNQFTKKSKCQLQLLCEQPAAMRDIKQN